MVVDLTSCSIFILDGRPELGAVKTEKESEKGRIHQSDRPEEYLKTESDTGNDRRTSGYSTRLTGKLTELRKLCGQTQEQ